MKKLFTVFAFLFTVTLLPAQDKQFGLKGGANFSDIMGGSVQKDRHQAKLGWHAGAFLHIPMYSPFFAIQPELLYSRKGYENVGPDFEVRDDRNNLLYSGTETGLVRLDYADLALMFTFRSGLIIFEIGPQFSVLARARNESIAIHNFPDGSRAIEPVGRYDRKDLSKIDLGLATGFRLQTENGASIGLRFNQGLLKISNSGTKQEAVPRGLNQVFQLYGGYLLPF